MSGAVVLVTGASRGIGAAIACRFAAAGHHVLVHFNQNEEKAKAVAQMCLSLGGNASLIQADLAEVDGADQIYATCINSGMMPTIIVHNAAVEAFNTVDHVSLSQWDEAMHVNVRSAIWLAKRFSPHLVKQRSGTIIMISSVWGQVGAANESLYAATKGALDAFTKSLAKELAPSGVTVNAVSPGVVDTEMNSWLDSEAKADLLAEIPLGRFALPEEIAEVVYFVARPESSYMTGQILQVSGGWYMK